MILKIKNEIYTISDQSVLGSDSGLGLGLDMLSDPEYFGFHVHQSNPETQPFQKANNNNNNNNNSTTLSAAIDHYNLITANILSTIIIQVL